MKKVGWIGVSLSLVAALLSIVSIVMARRRPRLFTMWLRTSEVMPEERISMVEEDLIR